MVLGKTTHLLLGKNLRPIGNDVKNPAAPFDQLRIKAEFCLDVSRQTGSLGIIISLPAIGN